MFDVGFSELLLCAVVALLVFGPERLPHAVRTVTLWIGRFRRAFNDIKTDIEREIGADDIRRQLHNEQVMQKLESGKQQLQRLQQELRAVEQTAQREVEAVTQLQPYEPLPRDDADKPTDTPTAPPNNDKPA